MKNDKNDIHSRLEELLKEDVAKWADRIGVSQSTIRDGWFKRKNFPTVDKIIRICEETGLSADYILFGKLDNIVKFQNKPTYISEALKHTEKILESNHPLYSQALLANITSFALSLKQEIENKRLQERLDAVEKEIDGMKALEEQSAKQMDGKQAA